MSSPSMPLSPGSKAYDKAMEALTTKFAEAFSGVFHGNTPRVFGAELAKMAIDTISDTLATEELNSSMRKLMERVPQSESEWYRGPCLGCEHAHDKHADVGQNGGFCFECKCLQFVEPTSKCRCGHKRNRHTPRPGDSWPSEQCDDCTEDGLNSPITYTNHWPSR